MLDCLILSGEGVLYLGEKTTEGGTGLKHRSDAKVPTDPPDTPTPATYGRKATAWRFLSFVVIFIARLFVECTADKLYAPDCYSYRNSTFGTSEKQTPLYSEQRTASVPPNDTNLYKITSESRQNQK